jgi:hypothetical protein
MLGIIYGQIAMNTGEMTDTWHYHLKSLQQTRLLFQHPKWYVTNIFQGIHANDVGSFFSSTHSYWNNLKANAFIKIISIFNCFSFGNYYTNVIFYSYLSFFGVVAVYKVMKHHLQTNRLVLMIACFLIPSFIYWCSGLHKDGFTFLATAIIIYHFYFYILKGNIGFVNVFWLLLGFFILFIFRNHILVALLPALFAWVLANKRPKKSFLIFAIVYVFGIFCFFGLKHIHPALNFPAFVVEKQEAFNRLKGGNTSIPVKNLDPDVKGFIKNLPQAISLSFFRPYFSDVYKPTILFTYIENMLMMLLILLTFLIPKKKLRFSAFGLFIVFFVVSVYLIIGYTVNNLGATIRYRSFLLPLYMPFILNAINWKKLSFSICKLNEEKSKRQ